METKKSRDKSGFLGKIVDKLDGVGDDDPNFYREILVIRYIIWFIWAIWELLLLGCSELIGLLGWKQEEE